MPSETEILLEVTVVIGIPGEFSVTVPLRPNHEYAYVDNLVIIAKATGPRLRFNEAELDFGLIGVGETIKRILVFTNESDVPAKYVFHPTVEVDHTEMVPGVAGKASEGPSGKASRSRRNTSDRRYNLCTCITVMLIHSSSPLFPSLPSFLPVIISLPVILFLPYILSLPFSPSL